jgi:CheY-like chemotaxis protein
MDKKRILIIDDEAEAARLLKSNLEQTGCYEARIENRPEDAMSTALAFKPHLMLLDVLMPRMFGGDLAAGLRANSELSAIPIIFLTAAIRKSKIAEHEGVITGAPVIAKPATVEEIIKCIEQYLPKGRDTPVENGNLTVNSIKKRIFVVDDETACTRLLKLNLEQTNRYVVRVENTATTALASAESFKPDLILVDVMMPSMGGGELAERFQASPTLRRVPIVFLTAAASKSEVSSRGGRIGGLDFLAKPTDLPEVIDCIEKHLAFSKKC